MKKRKWIIFFLLMLCGVMSAGCAAGRAGIVPPADTMQDEQEGSAIPLRGVIEGFYGTPWTVEDRKDMITFCGDHGLNAYIYAPKDDPYHRAKWREPYPKEKLQELGELVKLAKEKQVRVIFAVSPGLDLHFKGEAAKQDREAMLAKLDAVYALGVRDFAIFFDDIKEKDGAGQADFLNGISRELHRRYDDVGQLITVPTEYYLQDMQDGNGARKEYTDAFASHLDADILVLYTGNGVVVPSLTDEDFEKAESLYGRKLGIWWNYPVSDYLESKLALGPITGLPEHSEVPAIFFNPMKYECLSKIALATGADYAAHPESYEAQTAWERAIEDQYGDLAPDMMAFAEESQHMENDWANVGRPDGARLRAQMDAFWAAWKAGASADEERRNLKASLVSLEGSATYLEKNLPEPVRMECQGQLEQLKQMCEAGQLGLRLLEAQRAESKDVSRLRLAFKRECSAISQNEAYARISEKTLGAFLQEILSYAE